MFALIPTTVTYTATQLHLAVGSFAVGATEFPVAYTILNEAGKVMEQGTKVLPIAAIALLVDLTAEESRAGINGLLDEWGLEIDWASA